MRKFALIAAVALTASLALSACGKHEESPKAGQQASQQATKPTDPNDTKAWNAYLGQIVQNNMQGMKADRPYPYLVPAGDSEEAVAAATASCRTCRTPSRAACCRATCWCSPVRIRPRPPIW